MIDQNPSKPVRKVAIADHLWECFEQMAEEMGADRDGLINQALFMFARLNGFLAASASASPAAGARALPRRPEVEQEGGAEEPFGDEAAGLPVGSSAGSSDDELDEAPAAPAPPPPAPRRPAPASPPMLGVVRRDAPPVPDRPEVEAKRRPSPEPAPRLFEDTPVPASKPLDDDPVRREVAERVLETAAELERLIKGKGEAPRPAVTSDGTGSAAPGGEKLLYLSSEDGELLKVGKERFVIGRGKHCDFVINSGKVSREHAAVVRDAGEFYIEDLGSSNGTWFNKQRIKRRKIEEGDEYFICSEKIRCLFR